MRGKAVACAVALTLVLGGCGPSALNQDKLQDASAQASQAGVTVEQIKERGYLLVGTAGDYCPLSMREDSGTYWGLDADLAQDLACDLGVELRYVETSWPTILDDTVAGKFDLALCGVSRTDERLEKALMSDAYLVNGKTALMRAEDVGKYRTLDDINQSGVRVMENPGGTNEKLAREWLPNATIVIHDKNEEINQLIAEGKADVMITEVCEAGYYAGKDVGALSTPLSQGIGPMNAGSEDLRAYVNDFLAREEKSGRLDELRDTYINGADEELDQAA